MSLLAAAAFLARAGGGQSFDSGGGGGGGGLSGGGGGGGGFFFFGGGGGGGGGGGIVAVIVLVLILFTVFTVIRRGRMSSGPIGGRRRWGRGAATGTDDTGTGEGADDGTGTPQWTGSDEPAINSVQGDLFPGSHRDAQAGTTTVHAGLAEIAAHDPAFNEETFLQSVQRAFFVVQQAWSERKPEMSRTVMADGLWQQHRVQIEQYLADHKRNVLDDLAVGDLTIISAHSDQSYDTITVRVLAACADYDVDDNGRIVRGNRQVEQWQEDWTFQRSSSAVTKAGGGTLSSKCPNCGAPLDLDLQGVCHYCHAPVMSGQYDWVLARISQVRG